MENNTMIEQEITLICKDYDEQEVEVVDFYAESGASRVTIALDDIDGFDVDDFSFSEDLGEWDSYSVAKGIDVEALTLKFLVSIYFTKIDEDAEDAEDEITEIKAEEN